MNKKQIDRLIADIDKMSEKDLRENLSGQERDVKANKNVGTAAGAAAGMLAGLVGVGKNKIESGLLRALIGAGIGAAGGYGLSSLSNAVNREKAYKEIGDRRAQEIGKVLSGLDEGKANEVKEMLDKSDRGIRVKDLPYGVYAKGKGVYSDDDKLVLKKDKDGRPVLSLLFAGINSSVMDSASSAKSPLAARFYNKNAKKFSDVQANTIFDDPIAADAYIDKIVSKISTNRQRGKPDPRIRLVGYSAGGRGVVNFLKKMRERIPDFKVDEIIGIDPYQYPWENIPENLSDPKNPVADKIVYSRPSEKYVGSKGGALRKVNDVLSNTAVALMGKRLSGLAGNKVINNYMPNISHTDAEDMYESALEQLSKIKS